MFTARRLALIAVCVFLVCGGPAVLKTHPPDNPNFFFWRPYQTKKRILKGKNGKKQLAYFITGGFIILNRELAYFIVGGFINAMLTLCSFKKDGFL